MLVYKILINHRASVFIFSGNTEKNTHAPKNSTSRGEKYQQAKPSLKDINEEIQHQKLHGAPQYVTSPPKSNFGKKLAVILCIIMILLAFIFMGVHI